MITGEISRLTHESFHDFHCVGVSLNIETGLEVSFVNFEPRLGEAVILTLDDWQNLRVDSLGRVSSSSCMLIEPDAGYYQLKFDIDEGSGLSVWAKGPFEIKSSVGRVY